MNIQQDSDVGSNDFDVIEVFDADLNPCYTNYHIIAIYLGQSAGVKQDKLLSCNEVFGKSLPVLRET